MSSLAQLTPAQFRQLREERFNRVTALLNLDISWDKPTNAWVKIGRGAGRNIILLEIRIASGLL